MGNTYLRNGLFAVWQYCFYPSLIAGSTWISIWLLDGLDRDYWFLIPLIMTALLLPVIVLFEKWLPYRKIWQGAQADSWTDFIRTFIIFPLSSLLVLILLSIVKRHYTFFRSPYDYTSAPALFVGQNVVLFLVSDFCYYWVHRAFHRSPRLWPFHAIHHGATRVYSINSGKFHFFEACCSNLAYFTPMLILGASEDAIVLVTTLSLVTGFLEHANIDFRAGVLNYIFNTAELHRWHHSIIIRESNTNFGKVLSVWDLCFGTFWLPRDKAVNAVGIEGETIPASFMEQLRYPFKRPKNSSRV